MKQDIDQYFIENLRRRNPKIYRQANQHLNTIFYSYNDHLKKVMHIAGKVKQGFVHISPLIQKCNKEICPACSDVCCISKHGFYNYEDLIYLNALGFCPPDLKPGAKDSDPCQFLSFKGCVLERCFRPSGCNWYFCDPLLEYLESMPWYHEFDDLMREVAELWLKMIEEFFSSINHANPKLHLPQIHR